MNQRAGFRPAHSFDDAPTSQYDSGEIKYFVSNAPSGTPLEMLLHVAFGRWGVERCFEDAKGELGFSHFEVRNYTSLLRHMIITAASLLFLSRVTANLRGEKSVHDNLSGSAGNQRADPRHMERHAAELQVA